MTAIRAEIEQAISLAGPIYDTTAAIDVVEAIVNRRAAEALRRAGRELEQVPGNPYPLVVSEFLFDRAEELICCSICREIGGPHGVPVNPS